MATATTSHHITSHHITPHHITAHHITSHHITCHITSHHVTSHHIHITSHHSKQRTGSIKVINCSSVILPRSSSGITVGYWMEQERVKARTRWVGGKDTRKANSSRLLPLSPPASLRSRASEGDRSRCSRERRLCRHAGAPLPTSLTWLLIAMIMARANGEGSKANQKK